jgi:LytS/YehU family sensor histidine kinase
MRDRWTALLVFLLLGLVEEASVRQTGWFNQRIVVVCAASLLAGPGVGVIVGLISDLVGRYLRRAAAGYDRA